MLLQKMEGKRVKLLDIPLIMSSWPHSKSQATPIRHSHSSRLPEWLLPGKALAKIHRELKLGRVDFSEPGTAPGMEVLLEAVCDLWSHGVEGLRFSTLHQWEFNLWHPLLHVEGQQTHPDP